MIASFLRSWWIRIGLTAAVGALMVIAVATPGPPPPPIGVNSPLGDLSSVVGTADGVIYVAVLPPVRIVRFIGSEYETVYTADDIAGLYQLNLDEAGNLYALEHVGSEPAEARWDLVRISPDGERALILEAGMPDGKPFGNLELPLPGYDVTAGGTIYGAGGPDDVVWRLEQDGTRTVVAGGGTKDAISPGDRALDIAVPYPIDVDVGPDGGMVIAHRSDRCEMCGAVTVIDADGVVAAHIDSDVRGSDLLVSDTTERGNSFDQSFRRSRVIQKHGDSIFFATVAMAHMRIDSGVAELLVLPDISRLTWDEQYAGYPASRPIALIVNDMYVIGEEHWLFMSQYGAVNEYRDGNIRLIAGF